MSNQTYKGKSFMGFEIVDKEGNKIKELKEGDRFYINNCIFGGDEYVAKPTHKEPLKSENGGILTSYGLKLQGIVDDRPFDWVYGMCERGIGCGIDFDEERGWVATGYFYCPHIPNV